LSVSVIAKTIEQIKFTWNRWYAVTVKIHCVVVRDHKKVEKHAVAHLRNNQTAALASACDRLSGFASILAVLQFWFRLVGTTATFPTSLFEVQTKTAQPTSVERDKRAQVERV